MMSRLPLALTGWLVLNFLACKARPEASSETRQIFADQQRFDVNIANYSAILWLESGCTAFVIDRKENIAMTAKHCRPKVGDLIRVGYIDSSSRGVASEIREILAESADLRWDFVVFRYRLPNPEIITQEFQLATEDHVTELATARPGSLQLKMVGYPADSYRNGRITESRCDVRFPTEEFNYGFRDRAKAMLEAWERDPRYARHFRYAEMRRMCEWNVGWMLESPQIATLFRHDCSTYGGNSGGPIFLERDGRRIVIGLPYSYFPAGEFDRGTCFGEFYEYFWAPFWGDEFKKYLKWDRADRASTQKTDFPVAIPMHLIMKQHSIFQSFKNKD